MTYEDRCRLLLRSYPPRYRRGREEELLTTMLECAEPGRSAPSLRESVDVVRGGLATRLRTRPPLLRWLAYRLYDKRLPEAHREFARDDIMGRFYLCRRLLGFPLQLLAFQAVYAVVSHYEGDTSISSAFPPPYLLLWMGSILAAGLALTVLFPSISHRPRRMMLAKHGF
ncbi:hypothetical protein [Streptosporangium sp. NPDC000396]|uniref:hypothetical protein n=1 Tax=Streptosporangium sp. NPDC000396 TaxID=3366185 RepID=UPI0036C228CA